MGLFDAYAWYLNKLNYLDKQDEAKKVIKEGIRK